jgi:hypothetical protein
LLAVRLTNPAAPDEVKHAERPRGEICDEEPPPAQTERDDADDEGAEGEPDPEFAPRISAAGSHSNRESRPTPAPVIVNVPGAESSRLWDQLWHGVAVVSAFSDLVSDRLGRDHPFPGMAAEAAVDPPTLDKPDGHRMRFLADLGAETCARAVAAWPEGQQLRPTGWLAGEHSRDRGRQRAQREADRGTIACMCLSLLGSRMVRSPAPSDADDQRHQGNHPERHALIVVQSEECGLRR